MECLLDCSISRASFYSALIGFYANNTMFVPRTSFSLQEDSMLTIPRLYQEIHVQNLHQYGYFPMGILTIKSRCQMVILIKINQLITCLPLIQKVILSSVSQFANLKGCTRVVNLKPNFSFIKTTPAGTEATKGDTILQIPEIENFQLRTYRNILKAEVRINFKVTIHKTNKYMHSCLTFCGSSYFFKQRA